MRVGSVCTGYDGAGIALGVLTGKSVSSWHCEIEPAAERVLAHHFPDVPNLGNIKTVDWGRVSPVDVVTAGWPCQPFSLAGKLLGEEDERHLWPYVAEALCLVRPRYFIGENVRSHLRVGFGTVLRDLSGMGYNVRWGVLRASDAGAPHQRARVFILASLADGYRVGSDGGGDGGARGRQEPAHRGDTAPLKLLPTPTASDHKGGTHPERRGPRPDGRARGMGDVRLADIMSLVDQDWGKYEPAIRRWEGIMGRSAPSPTEPGVRTDRRLAAPFAEWMMGLPNGWVTDPAIGLTRTQQLKMIGNGIVPHQIHLALKELT